MAESRQFDSDRTRVELDHSDVAELDGGTVAANGEQNPFRMNNPHIVEILVR